MQLVKAQEARRAIDRLAGYEISELVRRKTGNNLTAGRVQSVALKLIVEREKSIGGFSDQFTVKLTSKFSTLKQEVITAQYVGASVATPHQEANPSMTPPGVATLQAVQEYMQTLSGKTWRLLDLETRPQLRQPGPAFTTSSLQQEAIKKLSRASDRWTAKRVMDVAQTLFAAGHITYMRTDSPNLSEEAVTAIEQQVIRQFGEPYFQARRFPVKGDAQEAHEAIRPTHMELAEAGTTADEKILYRLIYTRAMASQMKPAEFSQTILSIGTGNPADLFQAKASVVRFDGYRAIYTDTDEETAEDESASITPIEIGSPLKLQQMQGKQTFKQPPKRYDEASLVKSLEQKGIGRPSTYASILGTIQKRGYVEVADRPARKVPASVITYQQGQITASTEQQTLGGDKGKLIPTERGLLLGHFLQTHFPNLVDYSFTSDMEKQLDQIVEGHRKFIEVIEHYDHTHQQQIRQVESRQADVERQTVTRLLGDYKGKPVRVGVSKNGTYLLYDHSFTSVPNRTPEELTLATGIEFLEQATNGAKQKPVVVHKMGKYEVKQGQFGMYLTDGVTNAKLPAQFSNLDQVKQLKAVDAQKILKDYLKWKKEKEQGKKSGK